MYISSLSPLSNLGSPFQPTKYELEHEHEIVSKSRSENYATGNEA